MGTGIAGATVLVIGTLPPSLQLVGFGVLLGVAGGVYPGFASGESSPGTRALEWSVAVGFAAWALLGVALGPAVLALGWALHAVWDVLHHGGRFGAHAPPEYPWLCLAYDLVIAAHLLVGTGAQLPSVPGV